MKNSDRAAVAFLGPPLYAGSRGGRKKATERRSPFSRFRQTECAFSVRLFALISVSRLRHCRSLRVRAVMHSFPPVPGLGKLDLVRDIFSELEAAKPHTPSFPPPRPPRPRGSISHARCTGGCRLPALRARAASQEFGAHLLRCGRTSGMRIRSCHPFLRAPLCEPTAGKGTGIL